MMAESVVAILDGARRLFERRLDEQSLARLQRIRDHFERETGNVASVRRVENGGPANETG